MCIIKLDSVYIVCFFSTCLAFDILWPHFNKCHLVFVWWREHAPKKKKDITLSLSLSSPLFDGL